MIVTSIALPYLLVGIVCPRASLVCERAVTASGTRCCFRRLLAGRTFFAFIIFR
jgi:hypothetical protein